LHPREHWTISAPSAYAARRGNGFLDLDLRVEREREREREREGGEGRVVAGYISQL